MTVTFAEAYGGGLDFGQWVQVDGLQYVCTCPCVPEQFDVFADGVQVAYVRLRNGWLTVEMPEAGAGQLDDRSERIVYRHTWPDERYKGGFDDAAEAEHHLRAISAVITAKLLAQARARA